MEKKFKQLKNIWHTVDYNVRKYKKCLLVILITDKKGNYFTQYWFKYDLPAI